MTGIKTIEPVALASMLDEARELAFVDAREEGVYARSHPLFATPLPWSRIEERAGALIPRQDTPVIVTSDGEGLSGRAALRLAELGYTNVQVLDGGNAAWRDAGHRLFSGIHVPSKAFGELVEQQCKTPSIEAGELKRLLDAGGIVVFDSRPAPEFKRMNIPGAGNCPGAELVYRLPAAVASDETLVVINCAGRTRSIIGAQSLINAGFRNRVVALKNGTMGWHLAGFALEHGNERSIAAPGAEGIVDAQRMAADVRRRFGIHSIGAAGLEQMRDTGRGRTVYLLDVRTAEEFAAGHVRGSRHAPGGQLIQATDVYVATWNAAMVLIDDDGVRATMTASWLMQMGWHDVHVLDPQDARERFEEQGAVGPAWPPRPDDASIGMIDASGLASLIAAGRAQVVDLSTSREFRESHIAGARWAIRAHMAEWLPSIRADAALVFTSEDGRLAEFAAVDAAEAGRKVQVLVGGNAEWRRAGLPVDAGFDPTLEPPEDMWHIPSSAQGGGERAMREYLSWEVDLVDQVRNEPGVRFAVLKPGSSNPPQAGAPKLPASVTEGVR